MDWTPSPKSPAPILLSLWIYLNLIGDNILLPILVTTFIFSKRLNRHPTLINVCLTWILSGIFSLLLFYSHQYDNFDPPTSLCIAQASLLSGIIPMWTCSVFALFYYVYNSLQGQPDLGTVRTWIMLSGPYFVQTSFSAATLIISLLRPEHVSRRRAHFYCALDFRPLTIARIVVVGLGGFFIMCLEVALVILLYRNHSSIRRRVPSATASVQTVTENTFRILIFGVYIVFGTGVYIVNIVSPQSVLPKMFMASAGIVGFLLFGIKKEILRIWFPCFFRQILSSASTIHLHPISNSSRGQNSLDPSTQPQSYPLYTLQFA